MKPLGQIYFFRDWSPTSTKMGRRCNENVNELSALSEAKTFSVCAPQNISKEDKRTKQYEKVRKFRDAKQQHMQKAEADIKSPMGLWKMNGHRLLHCHQKEGTQVYEMRHFAPVEFELDLRKWSTRYKTNLTNAMKWCSNLDGRRVRMFLSHYHRHQLCYGP